MFSKLLPWLIGLAALLAGLALFRGSDKLKLGEETAPPSTAVAPAPKVAVPPVARPAPAVAVLPAKIYFDVGSQVIDGPSGAALAQTAVAVKNQGIAVDITGYTDKTGDVATNEALPARATRPCRSRSSDCSGGTGSRINLKPPAFSITTTGTGFDAEARRVEITQAPNLGLWPRGQGEKPGPLNPSARVLKQA